MVKEYLEKTRNGFMEEKISLMEQVTFLQNSMKQNIQMIQLLEDTNDPNIESFTPRQVNGYNRKKLLELQEEQKELIKQLNVLRTDASTLDLKIDEINISITILGDILFDMKRLYIFIPCPTSRSFPTHSLVLVM